MTNETLIRTAIALAGALFGAGGFYVYVGMALSRLKEDATEKHTQIRSDVNAIGRKVNEQEKAALRRHHNVSLVLMLAAPEEKETQISGLLKEDC